MKNEVNRTFTVKKNKFTNFLNCFYANTPQNTGGGNSHSSTVVTPIWKGSRPTVSRRSTDSQSQDHRNHTPISKALKYAAMILMVLTLGIGNAWGEKVTWTPTQTNVTSLTSDSKSLTVGTGTQTFTVYAIRDGNTPAVGWNNSAFRFNDKDFYKSGISIYIPSTSNDVTSIKFYLKNSNSKVIYYKALNTQTISSNPSELSSLTLTNSYAGYTPFASPSKGVYYAIGGKAASSGGDTYLEKVEVEFSSVTPPPTPSCTTPTIAWATGSTANISIYDALAATDLGIDVAEYTGNITWALSGDDIVTLSNQSKTGCTVTGKADAYGTETLTASFTLSGDATLCDGTYSVTKTITIKECVAEPAALTNEIARFQVPCDVDNSQALASPINRTECTCTFVGVGGNGNWYQNPISKLWYGKMSGDGTGKYITITLTSGSFQAGDVVTIAINRDNATKTGFYIKSTSGHTVEPASTASGVEAIGTYTLTADDINNDGSLTFYRSSSSTYVNRIIITRPVSCAATVPGDISKGDLTAGEITLTAAGSAETGDVWYWQSSATGEDKTGTSGATKTVNAAGTYYIRSYNTAGNCWSDAKSFELTAEDFMAHYAITYNKGAYGTGSIEAGSKTEGVAYTLSSDRFIREGYLQVGWALTDGGTKAYNLGGSYTTDAAQEFFPVWAEKSTYVASFACDATAPTGWTFSNAGTYGAEDATADYVCNFVTAGTATPKQTETGDKTTDDDVAFAKNTNAIATYDLGAASIVTALNVTLCGGSSSDFNETIEYLGTDGTTVKKSYTNSLSSGNLKDNLISKNEIVEGVRYIRVHGASKWVVMKAFSVTYVDLIPKYNLTFAKGSESASGSMSTLKYAASTEVTLPACTFTAPSGKEFDAWVVTETVSGDAVTVTDGAFTMPAVAVTATATWKDLPAKYKVEYYDGESKLGEEEVLVGSKPTASGITTTKEFYTFAAWQLSGVDIALTDASWASVAKDATVTLKARYTGQYTSGSYEFVNTATVGTNPSKTVTTSKVTYSAFNIDNLRFSGMDITYESGESTVLTDYKGWKINTQNATIKFLVENNSQVKVAIGRDNTAAVSYTALNGTAMNNVNQEKSTEVAYSVKAGTIFTISMTTGNTITLKRITISPLYNATYTDDKGDASGSANDVAEVTLGAPTEESVTVEKVEYMFTGWKANQIVKVGGVDKAIGTLLNADDVCVLTANTEFTAQWQEVSEFDVKFYQGYGEPDVQIGETQKISTGEHAEAPETDPTRSGYRFLGWSYDGTEAHIVEVASYAITATTNFTAMWVQQFTVTFDGAGEVVVDNGAKVSSPDSPVSDGKVFQGWYNGESKYNFSAAVTGNLALESKWVDADANHYQYAYNDAFHFDGVVYKTPEGKTTDPEADEETKNLTTPYIMFSGAAGITSIVATKAIYDYKNGADTKHVTAYLKLKKDDATSNLAFTVASGYTAVLKVKMGGYSKTPTVTLKKGDDVVDAASGTIGGTATGKNYNAITYNLTSGEYVMTSGDQTLYFSHIDLEAEAIPAKVVTYNPGEGSGEMVVDDNATEVRDGSTMFTAPEGKIFNGWKDGENNDVEVGTIVTENMTLTAQWISQYAVTFNMQGHGAAIATQNIKDGEKATEPATPFEMGWDFGGWFTDAECTVGNEFDFNTAITADRPLFAKWTAFDGCTELWPATSGDAPAAVGDAINMQTGSNGATMTVEAKPDKLSYTTSGLQFGSESGVKVNVVLNNDLTVGTKISLTLVSGGTGGRGLHLYNSAGAVKIATLGWSSATNGEEKTFTYTVVAEDGLDGTNAFQLWRNNTVCLKSLKVESCGDAVIYHDLTSAITPDHDPAYATVTLSATSVREGRTATATYSDIAEGMEFEAWEISGTGASIADASANPAVITMGTADAVVTLKVRTETPKHTVSYDMQGHGVAPADEEVKEGKKVTEPEVAEVEGWIFGGWYKEAGCTNAWDFSSDVMGTSNMTLYAKWTEDTSIRLIVNGAINSANYYTGATVASGTVEIDEVDYKFATLGGTASSPSVNALNKVITYNATSTRTKVMVDVYNNATSARQVKIFGAVEGAGTYETLATIDLDNASNKHVKSDYYEFNNDKNRTIYISVPSSVGDVYFVQVKVIESGEALPMFGQIGYSIDFNKGRLVGPSNTDIVFEGMNYNLSSNYQALSSSNISLTKNKSYQFTVPVPTQITIDGSKAQYYVTTTVDGEENSTNQDGAHSFNLAAGTWYLRIGASNMSVKSISFTYPQVEIEGEMDDDDLIAGADVVIPNGANLTLSENHTLHNLDIEAGGKISVAENKTLTVNNLTINSEAGKSGQLLGATNVTASAVYMDVTFFKGATELDETTANRWYMISAPFDVNLNGGFSLTDGTPMVFGQTDGDNIFDLFEYDGAKRASTGVTGWKRVQGKMKAGRACLIGFNPGQPTTIRLKAASTVLSEPTSITLNSYPSGEDANANWNGVANPTMHYTDLNKDVQTYNNEDGENGRKYIAYSKSSTSFVVGTAFFVQETGTIDLSEASHSEFRAPQRQANERYEACVRIARSEATDFADQMYVRASENATNEYEQGHDMITWNGTTANTALIWAENYGKRLAIEEAPMVNDKATYNLGIFVPVAGTYRIEVANPSEDATLYLTKNGRIFWNLTMGACELDLAQGQNNEYGLVLRADAPAVTTGMDEIRSEAGVQKIIIDENVFILRGEQLFDMTGKLVK